MIFMMWYDSNAKLSVQQKIDQAATHFTTKYGRTPTLCYLGKFVVSIDKALDEDNTEESKIEGIKVEAKSYVLNNTLWIG